MEFSTRFPCSLKQTSLHNFRAISAFSCKNCKYKKVLEFDVEKDSGIIFEIKKDYPLKQIQINLKMSKKQRLSGIQNSIAGSLKGLIG